MRNARILGISAYYHDSAAALVQDGAILAAVQEERFSRIKHDSSFPRRSVAYCLENAGLSLSDIDYVVYYEKPLIKFERLLETYVSCAPRGSRSFITAMPVWLKNKLFLKKLLRSELTAIGNCGVDTLPPLLFTEHHQAHAASAYYPSPFDRAAVLCMDGVGEWATTSVWLGDGKSLIPQWQMDFPHSLGLLYSAFTQYTGFKVNSGEYKLMGLAPYGEPRYVRTIFDNLLDLKEDGTFRLNMKYFGFAAGLAMTNRHFDALFGGPARMAESALTQRIMDIARSIQDVTEEIVLRLARRIHAEQGVDALCMAGGVALNCVANGRLLREGPFRDIWVQPASGDAGCAAGAALAVWHQYLEKPRKTSGSDAMQGSFLGPSYTQESMLLYLDSMRAPYQQLTEDELDKKVAGLLAQGSVVGWFQGRMEYGPRSLGNRSILGDARNTKMQCTLNLKIKHRESFRPFAPSVLKEDALRYFDLTPESPYMLFVAPVQPGMRMTLTDAENRLTGMERLKVLRSTIPAVTHVDNSARVQTVTEVNRRYHHLLHAFKALTGCSLLVNTSFNVRGEPIVCSPEDAYSCFMSTEMDYLVLGNCLLGKSEQPDRHEQKNVLQPHAQIHRGETVVSSRDVRRFILSAAGMQTALFGLLLPWLYHRPFPAWPWMLAAIFTLWVMLLPATLRPVYRAWMNIASAAGIVNNALLLGSVFFCILSPLGILMRWFGYDPLHLFYSADAPSYRTRSITGLPKHMENPY